MKDEPLLTASEAAAVLKVSVPAFLAWRRRHRIPNRIKGRSIRVYRSDLVTDDGPRVVDFAERGRQHAQGSLVS